MIIAIQAYFEAHRFIQKHKLWKWILIPGILYALMFYVSMHFFSETSSNFIEWIILKTGLKNWLDTLNNSFLAFFLPWEPYWFG